MFDVYEVLSNRNVTIFSLIGAELDIQEAYPPKLNCCVPVPALPNMIRLCSFMASEYEGYNANSTTGSDDITLT